MTYLLDTCVISEAMKKRPDPDDMTLVTRNVADMEYMGGIFNPWKQ